MNCLGCKYDIHPIPNSSNISWTTTHSLTHSLAETCAELSGSPAIPHHAVNRVHRLPLAVRHEVDQALDLDTLRSSVPHIHRLQTRLQEDPYRKLTHREAPGKIATAPAFTVSPPPPLTGIALAHLGRATHWS